MYFDRRLWALTVGVRGRIAFTVLILVLLVRPEGLFGKGRVEKV